ncbi:molybdenum ABC transporter, periplasmic molybdate-binding protein [Rhodomicrobium vannielii ATCC 17100]|jgi:molybdate transport system substrate-binding protein|uniref:Molybdenum ABC transporter, periplasmic molybdate-binding protein n=1 Tax=Rhodomicrobium vannielii (strain ATCC 17100 / DSM 162 / LMG 4299 / NCIMB 10020 / ATH 3.1.1) TaxID=648757 RepID=E3I5Q4_RHOVT|nr:molybdate ABC transporter substrate-binding protein [Rhodomicrobium vannielii]ADP69407.1 molybdenum ABC transporter, periplasmic molybdate-binding protein [Rhodomicrobium vannielii ATCC 17100]
MSFRSRFVATVSAALLSAALLVPQAIAQETKPVIVFAAASLKNALDAISADWQKETGKSVKTSYAASSALAKQLEQDAPADIFISADLDWMNYVEKKALIDTASRENLLGNAIVLIAPKDSTATIELKEGADLGKLVGDGRLAVGTVTSVPAGKYGKAALEKLGLWSQVENKLAQAESVRAALLLVSRGEAPLGIVYASDAVSDANVKVIASFPASSHPPIIYPIALTTKAGEDAKSFYAYVKSPKAAPHFEKQGFTVLADKKS